MILTIFGYGAHGGRGGIDLYVENIIECLIRNKKINHINLFTKKKVINRNKKISFIDAESNFLYALKIFKNIFQILRSDIILLTHINLIVFIFIPIFFKKKIILFTYGLDIWGTKKNIIYRYLVSKINFIVSMRKYTMNNFKKTYSKTDKFFFLLPNCIKYKNYKIKNFKSKNIISVARLDASEKNKGIDETLEALTKLNGINFKYFVVGDGDDIQRLKKKSKSLSLDKKVFFLGKLSNKKRDEMFRISHIISMPGSAKNFDTYPMRFVFLEAAQYGLKILASNPVNSDEKILDKKYVNLNFVNPKISSEITFKLKKLLSQKKYIDKKYLNDFSFNLFKKRINDIILKTYNN
tara:strand:+ start:1439 stop:2494 length:1056 start_codon:yes stop_codon:yes gene_type:complete